MTFVFGIAIGSGFTLTALITMMLYAAAQVDQALDPESVVAWQETKAASIDMPQNVGGGKEPTLPPEQQLRTDEARTTYPAWNIGASRFGGSRTDVPPNHNFGWRI
jgi:hypothetical protein